MKKFTLIVGLNTRTGASAFCYNYTREILNSKEDGAIIEAVFSSKSDLAHIKKLLPIKTYFISVPNLLSEINLFQFYSLCYLVWKKLYAYREYELHVVYPMHHPFTFLLMPLTKLFFFKKLIQESFIHDIIPHRGSSIRLTYFLNYYTLIFSSKVNFFLLSDKMKLTSKYLFHSFFLKKIDIFSFPRFHHVDYTSVSIKSYKEIEMFKKGRPLIGFLGRIDEYKGLDILIQVSTVLKKRGRDIVFLVAGTGNVVDRYKNQITSEMFFTNFEILPNEVFNAYFCSSDLILLPYKDSCISGILFYAQYFQKSCIGSKSAAFEELSETLACLSIVKENDATEFANCIDTFFGFS